MTNTANTPAAKQPQTLAAQAEALLDRLSDADLASETFSVNGFVHRLLAHFKQIAAIWSIDDVQGIRPDFTADQAWEVLEEVGEKHDAELGISWATLEIIADEMFPASADRNDLRFLDPSPCIVGLKAKGKGARDDRTGFVLDALLLPQLEAAASTAITTPISQPTTERKVSMTKPHPDPNWIHITVSGGLVQRVFCDVPAVVLIEDFDNNTESKPPSLAKWQAEPLASEELLRLLKQKAIPHRIVIQED